MKLAQAIAAVLAERLLEVHTMMPARVESYDAAKGTITAQPLIQQPVEQEDGSTVLETLPAIQGVPVAFPGGGRFRATFPLAQGDTVTLVFAEVSIDEWKTKGGLQPPNHRRRFRLADAVAVPKLNDASTPWKNASATDATMGHEDGPQAVFTADRVELGGTASARPTEKAVKGSTFRQHLKTMHNDLAAKLQSAGTAITKAGATLTGLGAAPTVPVTGAVAATIGTDLAPAGADLLEAAATLTQYETQAGARGDDLSEIVFVK